MAGSPIWTAREMDLKEVLISELHRFFYGKAVKTDMAASHAGINPLLIAALTGQAVTDIPPSPAFSLLPGNLVKSIIKYKKKIEPPKGSNREHLICGHCGCQDKYDLGLIAFNLERWKKEEKLSSKGKPNYQAASDFVQTTGYFRCKHCNSAGKWEFKNPFFIFGLLTRLLAEGDHERAGCMAGEIRLHDGTSPKWATDAEDAFLKKLIDNGTDGFLWNRLGNLYLRGGRPELAAAAFEKSIQEDPSQVESHYSLGGLLYQVGELDKSAYHSRMALVHAGHYRGMEVLQLREILAASLQKLFEIHIDSDRRIPFIPTKEELAVLPAFKESAPAKDFHALDLLDLELLPYDRKSFYPLAEMYMQGRRDEIPAGERTWNKPLPERKIKVVSSGAEGLSAQASSIASGLPVRIHAESEERAARIAKVCERFKLPYSIEIRYPEDLDDLEDALVRRLSLSNVYAPCPCGSGEKFKFCCARKVKNLDVELFIDEFGS